MKFTDAQNPVDSGGGDLRSRHAGWIAEARRQADIVKSFAGGSSGDFNPLHRARPVEDSLRRILPHQAIKGYDILGEIHRGGQGVVYRATQQSTGRMVAVKVMREGPFAGEHDRIRFEREVSVLAQLRDPKIVGIIDRGVAAGNSFFVMDYVDGRPLDRFADAEDLDLTGRLRLFADVCDAVNAAHLAGVIHRDLKPGNIFVDGAGGPHILDFGLAKVLPAEPGGATILSAQTLTGQFLGSMPWASPEQVTGAAVDTRTDVYSLGVVLFQLLTGAFPYRVTGSARDILENILTAIPVRPLRYRGGTSRISNDVEAIVLKCLEKERERRYQSAGELARDVRRYLAGEPVEAKRDSKWYVFRRTLLRHKLAVAVVAAFVMLVSAATLSLSILYRGKTAEYARAETERAQAVLDRDRAIEAKEQENLERQRATAEAAKAQAINTFLTDMLASADPAVARRPGMTVKQALDAARRKIDEGSFAAQPDVEIALRQTIGKTYFQLGLYADSEATHRPALDLARRQSPGDSTPTAQILYGIGEAKRGTGAYGESEVALRDSLAIFRRLPRERGNGFGLTLNELAILCKIRGRSEEAESLYREAADVARQDDGEESNEYCSALNNIAVVLAGKGELDEAEAINLRVLETRRRVLGPDHPTVAFSLNSLASLYYQKGSHEKAEPFFRETVALRVRVLGEEHPDTATSINNLGVFLDARGRHEEAVELHRQALALRRKLLGPDHADVAASLNNTAKALTHKKDYDAAEPLYREALSMLHRAFGDVHPYIAQGLGNLAELFEAKGDPENAEPVFREMLEVRRKLHGDQHPEFAKAQGRVGLCLLRQKKFAEAEPIIRSCLRLREESLKPDDWLIAHTRSMLGEILAAQQNYMEAEQLLIESYAALEKNPQSPKERLLDALQRLVRMYEAWETAEPGTGKAEKAAEWRAKLPTTQPSAPPS